MPQNQARQWTSAQPTNHGYTEQNPIKAAWETVFPDSISLFTAALVFATFALWHATMRIARDTKRSGVTQADKMERSIVAMRDANEIAQQSMKLQLRAYVDFDGVGWIRDPKHDLADRVRAGVRFRVRNYGHTPADGVQFKVTYSLKGGTESQVKPLASDPAGNNVGMISPQDHTTKNGLFDIPRLVWDALGENKLRFITEIEVRYVDVFDQPHTLTSAFENQGHDDEMTFIDGSRQAD